MKTFCTLLFFFIASISSFSGDIPELRFQEFPGKGQLSSQFTTSIVQDQKGYIWIGTVDGLNKYDGHEIKTYRNHQKRYSGLVNNNIQTLYNDSQNRLWIGTIWGLSRYHPDRDTFETLSFSDNPAGIENTNIYQIHESDDGTFYVAAGSSIYTYSEKKKKFSKLLTLQGGDIISFHLCRDGTLWTGQDSGSGLKRFLPGEYNQSRLPQWLRKKKPGWFDDNSITDMLHEDSVFWIGTRGGGLIKIDQENKKLKKYLKGEDESFIVNLYKDREGNIWSCDYTGLKIYNEEEDYFHGYHPNPEEKHSIQQNPNGILQDHQENYWVTYSEKGFGFSPIERGFHLYDDSPDASWPLFDANTMAITEDHRGHLWTGGFNGGITVFHWEQDSVTTFEHDPDDPHSVGKGTIFDIYSDSNGTMWVGSYRSGLQKYDPGKNQFISFKHDPENETSINGNDVRSIVEDSVGNLWIAVHGEGVDYFDKKSETFRHLTPDNSNLSIEWINEVFVDSKNTLWVGTSYGLNKLEAGRDSIEVFITQDKDTPGTLSSNNITSIHETPDETIWVGTTSGLHRYLPESNTFEFHSEEFNNQYICSIEHDANGQIWVSTHGGITHFNPRTKKVFNFDKRDGLQSNDFNTRSSYFDGHQHLFFGGPGGVNAFDPDEINYNLEPPRVVFTEFRLLNEPVQRYGEDQPLDKHISVADEIKLEYDNNFFTIEYAALNYLNPEKNEYAYRMEGIEDHWNQAGNKREATYTNLDPGTYTFRVKAANNDGIWNEKGTSIRVVVQPPWYMTTWFKILAVVLAIVLVYLTIMFRTSILRRQKAALTELVNQRTRSLHEKNHMLQKRTLELNQFNQQLEEQKETIEEQAEELQHQAHELKKSNKELQKLNSTKDRLFSIIAHDVRGPFNTIIGFSSLLQEMASDQNNPMIEEYSGYIFESSNQVLALLENLLYWARSQTNEITFNPSKTSLKNICEENIKLLYDTALRKDIRIDTSNIDYQIELEADEDMLRTVVRNFLSNAIKFTPENGKVSIISEVVEDQKIKLLVTDTGKGMSPKEVEQIKRIGQLNTKPGTEGEKGSGLGLAISKEFIDRHGGEMVVDSSPGEGSTFGFIISLKQETKNTSNQ
ncbi:MAG: ligand-binding sensor domain-containing protein [Bacteroidota bacterium]